MDFITMLQSVNYLAVLVATLSAFVIGGIWYSPAVFGKQWMKEVGVKESDAKKKAGQAMAKSFLITFIMATTLALFTPAGVQEGFMTGALLGFGIAAMNSVNNMVYELKSSQLMLINAGFAVVMYLIMGVIIGAWQ